jgi:DNA-binding CsgD family transcriptional regulator
MLNREIGSALGMTEGTVKWYLQRIYDKLGIRRRSQVAMLVAQWHSHPAQDAEALH